jgi:hypothetical protein
MAIDHHAYLEKFTVIGRCLYAEGWANNFDPEVWYDGTKLNCDVAEVNRPELFEALIAAGCKGFVLCAILPTPEIDRRKFRFRFSAGVTMYYPAGRFSHPDDRTFATMLDGFRQRVNSSKGSLLEIGSRARSGASYKDWFSEITRYLGTDITDGPNVDVVCDAHSLSRSVSDQFDFVFSMATFEHLRMPWKVAIEMNRATKVGAQALIISHAAWPLHEEPWDFFRFSRESWRGLFNAHTGFKIVDAQYQYPAQIIPNYISDGNFEIMSQGRTYLLSGCVAEKIGDARVSWDADVAEVYNLSYSHA